MKSICVIATAPAATAPVAQATLVKETWAELKAEKKQIKATEKMAKAECKKLKGADKSTCKGNAGAQEKAAMVDLKAKK